MSFTPAGFPGQPEPPDSPDGRWWWNGERWIPNAENPYAPPLPAAGATYTPGPIGVPHPYVPPRDVNAPAPDRPLPSSPQPRRWTPAKLVAVVVTPLLVVVLGIGGLFWLSIRSFEQQRSRVVDEQVRTAIEAAGWAMTTYHRENSTFPNSLVELGGYGYIPDPDVDVVVVSATPASRHPAEFCLAAGPAGSAPTAWFSDSAGVSSAPCS